MTVPVIKIKVLPKPILKGRMDVRFPAKVETNNFLTVSKANGIYTFDVDYTRLITNPITDQANSLVVVYDQGTQTYKYNSVAEIVSATDASVAAVQAELDTHEARTDNPHSVTKAQVGLGNVDNTSDATKNSAVATLTNKTLTNPVITQIQTNSGRLSVLNGASAASLGLGAIEVANTLTGLNPVPNGISTQGGVGFLGSTSGMVLVKAAAVASGTLTLPSVTGVLVADTAAQALTNKTISGSNNTLTNVPAGNLSGNIPVSNLASGLGADGTTFWRGDGTWAVPPGGSGGSFTQAGTGAVTRTMQDKVRESLSVGDFFAVVDIDWTNAFQRAHDRGVALGGAIIRIPPNVYDMTAFPVTSPGIIWEGEGIGSVLRHTADGDFITLTGGNTWLRDVMVTTTFRKTTGYMITLTGGNTTGIENIRLRYGYNGVLVTAGTQYFINQLQMSEQSGPFGVRSYGADAAHGVTGVYLKDCVFAGRDFPSTPAKRGLWAASTSYAVGDIAENAGRLYVCTTAGTSASSGGPSGLPSGTTPDSQFTNTITDGSAQWRFVNSRIAYLVFDSFSYSLSVFNVAILWGYYGFLMTDAVNLGDKSSMPHWVHNAHFMATDTCYGAGTVLQRGGGFHAVSCAMGTCVNGYGLYIDGSFSGDVSVLNSRIDNNWASGIILFPGPVGVNISHNFIGVNSQATAIDPAQRYSGITIGAASHHFRITDNHIGPEVSLSLYAAQNGISLDTGCHDFVIADNDVTGNNINMVVVSPTGTYAITDNLGYVNSRTVNISPTTDVAGSFTFAHGLASTPTKYFAMGFVGAGTSPLTFGFVSADATNITMRAFLGTSPLASTAISASARVEI